MPTTVRLPTYAVTIGPHTLDDAGIVARRTVGAYRYALITDACVAPLYADRVVAALSPASSTVYSIAPGERHKTRESWARVTDEMLGDGVGRDAAVIALGGGVVGDLAGFVAATYMRGIPLLHLPTTLLAMVDAAIGGKTGVDTPAGKNLVGAFHAPAAVVADTSTLRTLPSAERRSGLAEALKHGVVADAAYFARTVASLPTLLDAGSADDTALVALVARSVEIKASIVAGDEREGGRRKVLNFGHTLGHAIERLSEYSMLHGDCVAIGMVLESTLAERMGVAEQGTAETLRRALASAGLPVALPPPMTPRAVLDATRTDKKARRGVVEYALPLRIGVMAGGSSEWAIPVPDSAVLEVLGE